MGPALRPKTVARYRTDVVEYLIPGLGAHRLDKLQPEHIEKLYVKLRARRPALASSSIYHVHATLRTSLNEALRRRHIVENPALVARAPQLVEPEIEPLTLEEARRILATASERRNGVRFALALAMGFRQGEAIGLKWSDLDVCGGTITVRRALQRGTWRHGCADPRACAADWHKTERCPIDCRHHTRACPPLCPDDCKGHARHCPRRQDGGVFEADTKSRAGRRVVSVPRPLMLWLERHRQEQRAERNLAVEMWQDGDWMFAQPTGRPLDPRRDYQEWRDMLTASSVRPARLHDARHTAATMLLVLKVPVRAVMDIMGWSEASMASRYMHVPDELKREIAGQVGGLLWASPSDIADAARQEGLSRVQEAAIRDLADTLPDTWRSRLLDLLQDGGDDGPAGVLMPA
ncbi:tyrosine-type recombinase/integrase [Pseudonocardia sp. ICBG1142]|uniref:tyrosine-type recombinase/integrase n=1 Tax=Pseudonocardia sp. ICBG1142 TaxID=2846760 RepID=UPI0027E18546|nr:tyrosine-type recombinase/integrase [Pseudonocardia sp. ICBG1142]